jgi:hypothetical protein
MMPLKLLERVLPWLVAVLSEEQAKEMLRNIRLAGNMLLYTSLYHLLFARVSVRLILHWHFCLWNKLNGME